MAKAEIFASSPIKPNQDIEQIRNILKTPKHDYVGPAYLISIDGIVPITIIGDLGKIDEPSGKRHRFTAHLNLPTVKNRIQGGLWDESVGVKKALRFLQRIKPQFSKNHHIAQEANQDEDLMQIPNGYHGPAVIIDGKFTLPIYVGGLGERIEEGHIRANLMFSDVRRRLEGEIDANNVYASSFHVERFSRRE